jgi:hypothetical protein
MNFIEKILVPKRDSIFTARGERDLEMKVKGTLFRDCWDELKDLKPKALKEQYFKRVSSIQNVQISKKVIQDMYENIFGNSKRMMLLRTIEADGVSLRFGKEASVKTALLRYIMSNESISSINYVKNILNTTHMAFYAIGRERKWADHEVVSYLWEDLPLMNVGNPISHSTKHEILEEFKAIANKRQSRYTVVYDVTRSDAKDEANTEVNGKKTQALHKQGLAVSVAMIYYVMMKHLAELLIDMTRLNDTRRFVNVANLVLLYAFCLHEGCRPGDTTRETSHDNLWFWLGEEFSLLTLAFVRPETLRYLMTNGLLKQYVFESYKGKKVSNHRGRIHSWMPNAHNSLDLATLYIIMMRVILFINPSAITLLLFKKGLNVSGLRLRKNKKAGIFGLTMYSIRYGAAEDFLKYNIPANWVRYVLGHFQTSFMKNRYGNNLNQRVSVDNVMSLLGCDVMNTASDDSIPLSFNGNIGAIKQDAIPKDMPSEIIYDLRAVKKDLSDFLRGNKKMEDISELIVRIPTSQEQFLQELKQIPFGSHVSFREKLLTTNIDNDLQKSLATIHPFFAEVEKPAKVPLIWSYPQIIFGEWNDDKGAARRGWDAIKAQEFLTEIKNIVSVAQGGPPVSIPKFERSTKASTKSKKKMMQPIPSISKKNQKIKKHRKCVMPHEDNEDNDDVMEDNVDNAIMDNVNEDDIVDNDTEEDDIADDDVGEWKLDGISVGDVVGIVCSNNDAWSIAVPGVNTRIWLCVVSEVEVTTLPGKNNGVAKGNVFGQFYSGTLKRLILDRKKQRVHANDLGIVCILNGIEDYEHFALEKDERKLVKEFMERYY